MRGVEDHHVLSRTAFAVFAVKAQLLRLRRTVQNAASGRIRRLSKAGAKTGQALAEVITPLYTDSNPHERALQLGKVQNLRIAAKSLDGRLMGVGDVFSFWAHVGRPHRGRGFVEGRELRQGCLIPTVAGGLCQLSNSLYRAAQQAGCEIVERHGHTAAIPDSPFAAGEDATVFWNYVDLRFRSRAPMCLRVRLTEHDLVVRLEALP